jgi:AcrR family transcriptional regulator
VQPETTTPRERIIEAAAQMLTEQGRHALTTRAVATAAGAHAPTIYRQFGDMRGLLDAVASRGFDSYLANNVARDRHEDPVDDLRSSWDAHIRFGLTQPALYALMFGDPATTIASTAAERAAAILAELIGRIARAGQLRVSEDDANAMIRAAGMGVVFQLLATPAEHRSLAFSHAMREAVLASVTVERADTATTARSPDPVVSHAVALRSLLEGVDPSARLTGPEAGLLREWLGRLAHPGSPVPVGSGAER